MHNISLDLRQAPRPPGLPSCLLPIVFAPRLRGGHSKQGKERQDCNPPVRKIVAWAPKARLGRRKSDVLELNLISLPLHLQAYNSTLAAGSAMQKGSTSHHFRQEVVFTLMDLVWAFRLVLVQAVLEHVPWIVAQVTADIRKTRQRVERCRAAAAAAAAKTAGTAAEAAAAV